MHEVLRTCAYGLVAAASPVALLGALAAVSTGRGRATGLAFTAAFVLGQSAACVVALVFFGSAVEEGGGHSAVAAYFELAAGAALLLYALRARTVQELQTIDRAPRTDAIFGRLENTKPRMAFAVGLPLGIGAKRLAITILAAGTLAAAELGPAAEVTLPVIYVVIATAVVWIPVVLYTIFGTRADAAVADSHRWIVTHEREVTLGSAVVLGIFLVLDAFFHLLA